MKKEKEIKDPIKEHFSKMGKKSWEVRKAKLLKEKMVGKNIGNTNLG